MESTDCDDDVLVNDTHSLYLCRHNNSIKKECVYPIGNIGENVPPPIGDKRLNVPIKRNESCYYTFRFE